MDCDATAEPGSTLQSMAEIYEKTARPHICLIVVIIDSITEGAVVVFKLFPFTNPNEISLLTHCGAQKKLQSLFEATRGTF